MQQPTDIRSVHGVPVMQRTFSMEAAGSGEDDQEIALSFSSELPADRSWGVEILDHSADAVNLTRLASGSHPLLLNHDPDRQVGVIKTASIGEDRKGRAVARFGRGALAAEVRQDVADGIRGLVSVGYMIHRVREEDASGGVKEMDGQELLERMQDAGKRGKSEGARPVYRVVRWEPYEISIVALPVDPTVGIGRAAQIETPAALAAQPVKDIIVMDTQAQAPGTPLAPAAVERERVKEIIDIGEHYANYVSQKDIADACRGGLSVDKFRDLVMEKMASKHIDTTGAQIGMEKKEIQRYSFGRALVAAVTGDWRNAQFELEASRAAEKVYGKAPEGFYVPLDVWARRDFNVGTGTEAGNLVQTSLATDLYVDALRNALVMAQLGVRIMPGLTGNIDIPRKSVAGTLGMLSEIGSASETNPNIQKATLSPHRVGAYTEVSKQALIQSALSLENLIRDDLVIGAAVLLESQMLSGTGTGVGDTQIKGIRQVSGIGSYAIGSNGGALDWTTIVQLESACADANAEPDRVAGYLVNTKTRGKAKRTTKSTYLGWLWDQGGQPLNGYRAAVTNNLPSNLTKGTSTTICSAALFSSDWSMGVIGLFGGPDVTVDPYTLAATGQVRITLNQFADFAVRQPAAFSKCEDILTT